MTRNVIHSDETLKVGSDYLEYHVNMYVHSLIWLRNHEDSSLEKNAVLESHLIHARILIHFLSREESHYTRDVLAVDYFHDMPNAYSVLNDKTLNDWAGKIGKRAVHITTEPMPDLKSDQAWDIGEIAQLLVPALREFIGDAAETRLYDTKAKYLGHLDKLSPPSPV